MQLADKDVVVVIGPSRAGKGTLLAALSGQRMELKYVGDESDDERPEALKGAD